MKIGGRKIQATKCFLFQMVRQSRPFMIPEFEQSFRLASRKYLDYLSQAGFSPFVMFFQCYYISHWFSLYFQNGPTTF